MPHARTLPFTRRLAAAVIAALTVAVATHAATVLLFFSATGGAAAQLQPINDFFAGSSLVLFLILVVAGILGVWRRWHTALAAGVVGGIIAALVGTLSVFVRAGNPITPEVLPSVMGTLLGNNLFFVVAASLAAVFAGTATWRAVLARDSRPLPGTRHLVLVRAPAPNLADGELTHLDRVDVDTDLADTQWEAYVAALEAAGFETVEVEPADSHADSVFVEDAMVVLDHVAVLTSPGAPSRRGEIAGVEASARLIGLDIARIELPGTLDGGDVLKIGRTVYVGRGGRTNAEGIRQFRAVAGDLGYTVVAVPVSRVLHLKSAVTALPDGTVVGFSPLVEHPELFDRFLAVPEETGAAVVVLAPDTVLMSASAPLSAALIADLGYRVITVDISEFEKLEGCVTCLSVRVR